MYLTLRVRIHHQKLLSQHNGRLLTSVRMSGTSLQMRSSEMVWVIMTSKRCCPNSKKTAHGSNSPAHRLYKISHLLEPFFTTKEARTGTGLGLATIYGIVKQNEGFINSYNEPSKGSTFCVYLPRFVGEAIASTSESTSETPKGNWETVLLVEDEAAILNVSKALLQELSYKVLTAARRARH